MKTQVEINIEDVYDNLSANNQREFLDYIFKSMLDAEQADWIIEKIKYSNNGIKDEVIEYLQNDREI